MESYGKDKTGKNRMATFRYTVSIVLLLLTFGITAGLASDNLEVKTVRLSDSPTNVNVFDRSDAGLRIRIEIGSLDFIPVATKTGDFILTTTKGLTRSHRIGEPNVPIANRLLSIPYGSELTVEVEDYTVEEISLADYGLTSPLIPVQPSLSKSQSAEEVPFEFNDAIYKEDRYYSLPLGASKIIGVMRSLRLGMVTVAPVQYNPIKNSLRIYKEITVRIRFENADWQETYSKWSESYSPFFESVYGRISNYQSIASTQDDLTQYPVKYVIVADRMFETQLQPFIEWKTKKGFTVVTAYTDEIGSTSLAIKNYLQNLYNSGTPEDPAPSFVLLVGDDQQIPAFYFGGHKTDLYFCEFTGDTLPEIYYGRFSALNTSQLQPQIDKTLEYEKYEMPDPDYLGEVTMVSGVDIYHASTYGNGQINYGTSLYFNAAHGIYPHVWLYPESGEPGVTDSIIQIINDGIGFTNYTAHCNHNGWGNPAFNTSHINNDLTNIHKYLLGIGNCCESNTFGDNYGENPCFGEVWLQAENKGGIGYIGGTDGTYWDEDYWWGVGYGPIVGTGPTYEQTGLGAYDGVFHDHDEPVNQHYVANAAIIFCGNLAVTESGSDHTEYYWEIYTLMGDPAVMTYMGIPSENNVSYPDIIIVMDSLAVISANPGSYVGLSMNGELHGQAYIGPSGTVEMKFTPFIEAGDADIVITAQNRIPHISTIAVTPPTYPFLVYDDNQVDDIAGGNGNGVVDPGENIVLGMQIKNIGAGDAMDVNATLSATDTYITIIDSIEFFGNIPGEDGTVNIADAFTFDVAVNIPDLHEISFTLTMTDVKDSVWSDDFSITAHAPVLEYLSLEINDAAGNADGYLDPGETAELVFTLRNNGTGQADNLTAVLGENDPYITVDDGNGWFGSILPDGGLADNSTDLFIVSADLSCPLGNKVSFNLDISGDNGFSTGLNADLEIGRRVDFHYDDFSFDQGWEGLSGPGEWTIDTAMGGIGNDGVGGPDPAEDHSPSTDNKVLGNDLAGGLGGDYSSGLSTAYWVTSPIIDCSHFNGVMLNFYRWLGVQSNNIDHARLQAYDGSDWIIIFENGVETLDETAWSLQEYDMSAIADSNSDFRLRFGLGPTNDYSNYCGWNIDDLILKGYGRQKSGQISFEFLPLIDSLVSGEIVDDTLRIHNLSTEDTLLIQFDPPVEPWLSCSGEQLYIAPLESYDMVVTINATDMDPGDNFGFLTYTSNDYRHKSGGVEVLLHIYSPQINIPAESVVKSLEENGQADRFIEINNLGSGLLEFEAVAEMFEGQQANWLSVLPGSGTIEPGQSDSLTAGFDAATLELGQYTGRITVTSNDPVTPSWVVPITLKVIVCGDANGDENVNTADAVYLTNYIFHNGPAPDPIEAGDTNGDGSVNLADAVYIINYVFNEGPAPLCP